LVRQRRQIEALASGPRQAVVDHLDALGPLSVAQLARLLGRPADALYHHLRLLARVGLVRAAIGRGEHGRSCTLYELAGRDLRLDYEYARPTTRSAIGRVMRAFVRTASRDFERALARADVAVAGPRREIWAGRRMACLSVADLEQLNELLQRAVRAMQRRNRDNADAADRIYGLTFVLAPVGERGRAPRSPRSKPRVLSQSAA
jgi:predicted ArsR family transcriptional regulator